MEHTARPVVVGMDGSAPSLAAADYAAHMAIRRGRALRLVYGYLFPLDYGASGLTPYAPAGRDPRAEAETMLSAAAAPLRERYPSLEIDCAAVAGAGPPVLIQTSREAEVVVVGSRGLGGFAELLLGSVSSQVAAHANGPVVVVRPAEATPSETAPVVVGVDGSPESAVALEFAFAEAAARGSELIATHVYWPDVSLNPRRNDEDIEREAGERANRLVTGMIAHLRDKYPQLTVRTALSRHVSAERRMVEACHEAGLIVVGARGRGGFAGLLLGSVSRALVHHACCPVAVVHPRV